MMPDEFLAQRESFLQLSRKLNNINFPNKLNYHIVRYKFFYDNSTKGHECKYCRATFNLSISSGELEELEKLLPELSDIINIEELKDVR